MLAQLVVRPPLAVAANAGLLTAAVLTRYYPRPVGGWRILRLVLHAAIWHAVGRIVDRLPFGLVVDGVAGALVVGLVGLKVRSTRRGRRTRW